MLVRLELTAHALANELIHRLTQLGALIILGILFSVREKILRAELCWRFVKLVLNLASEKQFEFIYRAL